jgi:selenide,water dikinase
MLLASEGVSAQLYASQIPLLDGALDCIRAGHVPAGLNANREFAECMVTYDNDIPEEIRTVLFDPQTAGGVLVSVAPETADALVDALRTAGVPAREIGEITVGPKPLIHVKKYIGCSRNR